MSKEAESKYTQSRPQPTMVIHHPVSRRGVPVHTQTPIAKQSDEFVGIEKSNTSKENHPEKIRAFK